MWARFRKQVTEAVVSGRIQGDDHAPRLLALSRSRLVNGAVVTEAYESTKRTAVRKLQATVLF